MDSIKRAIAPVFEARTYLEAAYLLLGLFWGILWFTLAVTLFSVGIGTAIIWVGVPIFIGTQALMRPLGAFERLQVKYLLGKDVPRPGPLVVSGVRPGKRGFPYWVQWSHAVMHDQHGWRVLGWVGLRIILGPVAFSLALTCLVLPLALLGAPVAVLFGVDEGSGDLVSVGWSIPASYGPILAIVVTPAMAWCIRWLADVHRWLAAWLLGPCGDEVRRAALARASRAEEQIRIDQELHDSIGHMVSMIVVQSGAAAHVFDKDPAFARRALSNIEERGRAALGELDRIIARIRGREPETKVPLPGVDDLPALIAGARDAGVAVTSRLAHEGVPPAVGRGIYRVVQEALTNAAKHAPGSTVEVEVVSRRSLAALSIVNTVPAEPASAPPSGGNGLASIRDRVAILGGHATVGPTPDGRFAVRAVLPFDEMLPEGGAVDCTLTSRCRCLACRVLKGKGNS